MPKDGEIRKSTNRRGRTSYQAWRDGAWRPLLANSQVKDEYQVQENRKKTGGSDISYSTVGPKGSISTSLRYPRNMNGSTDYVLFDFYEYKPPFQGINKGATKDANTKANAGLALYNQSAADASFYEKTSQGSVVLYMPEDISTGYKANWSGKAFSNIGAAALSMAGSGDLGQGLQNGLNLVGTGADQLLPNAGNKIIREVVSKITGEQLDQNDVFGSTRGVILNPNVELLFGGTDLRNFQLNFKLVPRNGDEAADIKKIINSFRKAMLPRFSNGTELATVKSKNVAASFIKVPNFCKVSFMRGGSINTDVPQYKMCAITQVDVNYTPDGTYSITEGGQMTAIQLSLNFQESKLIFAEEVEQY